MGVPEELLLRIARLVPPRLPPSPGPRARRVGGWVEGLLHGLPLPINPRYIVDAIAPTASATSTSPLTRRWRVPIPAANGHFTARSLCAPLRGARRGRQLDGARILSADALRRATRSSARGSIRVMPFPMHWRLGFHRAATTHRGTLPQGFGHFGFGGSGGSAIPRASSRWALALRTAGVGAPSAISASSTIGGAAVVAVRRRDGRARAG